MLTESEKARLEKLVEKKRTQALTEAEVKEIKNLQEKRDQPK